MGREGETSLCGCLSHTPTGYLACNPGMCPDWESNRRPFGSQAGTQSSELQQPGLCRLLSSANPPEQSAPTEGTVSGASGLSWSWPWDVYHCTGPATGQAVTYGVMLVVSRVWVCVGPCVWACGVQSRPGFNSTADSTHFLK